MRESEDTNSHREKFKFSLWPESLDESGGAHRTRNIGV